MALVETYGIILKSYSLSDADKIVVFLTEKEGLVRGVAKGAKRLKSKFGGTLEPFSIVHLTYIHKEERELVTVYGVELVQSFFNEASNPMFLKTFGYLVDLLTNFTPPHDPDERLYKMAKVCLESGSNNTDRLETIALYFEFWILKLGGYLPDWKRCGECRRILEPDELSILQIDFRLFCKSCANPKIGSEVTSSARKLFFMAQKVVPDKFVELTSSMEEDLRKVSNILKKIISRVLDRDVFVSDVLDVRS